MREIKVRSIEFPALPPTHLGTSNTTPHEYEELLVDPVSVTPRFNEPLLPQKRVGRFYAKLYEIDDGTLASPASGPRYFGVAFRFGITDIGTVNIFCHPVPGNAGMQDNDYPSLKGTWSNLFRYIQHFGVQLAAGGSNMVLVMPMFSNATYTNLGIFNKAWHEIIDAILVEVQKVAWPDKPGEEMVRNRTAMKNVILSDFSRGRPLLSRVRNAPGMAALLREIWDFDGVGGAPPGPPKGGRAFLYTQGAIGPGHNVFYLPLPRWARFPFYAQARLSNNGVHGDIPQRLCLHASRISEFGH